MPYPRRIDWKDGGRLLTRGHFGQCPYCHRPDVVLWSDGEPNHQHRWSWPCRAASNRLRPDERASVAAGERDAETGRWKKPWAKRTPTGASS